MKVPTRSIALAGTILVLAACSDSTSPPNVPSAPSLTSQSAPEGSHFNLNIVLRGDGSGHVEFRQPKDDAFIIYLDTKVRDLEANTAYVLQRAADTNLDGVCSSTAWLTLGKGLVPQAIITDEKGSGEADLSRDVTALGAGATFDIAFRVVNVATSAVVLTSDCYRYTIRQ